MAVLSSVPLLTIDSDKDKCCSGNILLERGIFPILAFIHGCQFLPLMIRFLQDAILHIRE
jgi:hypothetical protein